MDRILVTGSAGFIGFHLCKELLKKKIFVTGIDNLDNYYDVDSYTNLNYGATNYVTLSAPLNRFISN